MKYSYKTKGVCSSHVDFDIEDGIVRKVNYCNGCNGNLQAIGKLVEGMKVEDVVAKLKGIRCDQRQTSCADQLAVALEKNMKNS